jgi:hypothetical protein
MTIIVRYRANDLSEGLVDTIEGANEYEILEDNTLLLKFVYYKGNKRFFRRVGHIHRDRWDSVFAGEISSSESD